MDVHIVRLRYEQHYNTQSKWMCRRNFADNACISHFAGNFMRFINIDVMIMPFVWF